MGVMGKCKEQELKLGARLVAKLIRAAGHDKVKFSEYLLCQALVRANLGFPVRIDRLAVAFPQNARYTPEISNMLVFSMQDTAETTFLITVIGHVTICGQKSVGGARDALGSIYGILEKFSDVQKANDSLYTF